MDMQILSAQVRSVHVGHSNLVCQRMVGVEVQIPVCVGLFSEHLRGQGTISMRGNHGVQEWECSFHLRLNGEMDGWLN